MLSRGLLSSGCPPGSLEGEPPLPSRLHIAPAAPAPPGVSLAERARLGSGPPLGCSVPFGRSTRAAQSLAIAREPNPKATDSLCARLYRGGRGSISTGARATPSAARGAASRPMTRRGASPRARRCGCWSSRSANDWGRATRQVGSEIFCRQPTRPTGAPIGHRQKTISKFGMHIVF